MVLLGIASKVSTRQKKKKKQHKEQPTFLNTELPYDPVIQLLDGYPKKKKNQKPRTRTPMFMAALFTMAERYPSVDEWINLVWYTDDGILFCLKKE